MKKVLCMTVLLGLISCTGQKKEQTVVIENPTQSARPDEAVVLKRAQLRSAADNLVPALVDTAGNYAASQVDDLDGDGKWDELAFVTDLAPAEKVTFKVVWLDPAQYPKFPVRTNVRYGKMTVPGHVEEQASDMHYKDTVYFINTEGYPYQMDGIGWENDKVGFRHYYDGRNCRDYFGKRVSDMVLDTVGLRADGTPGDTYHVWADWGRDILSVSTFGLGGLGGLTDDGRFVRLGRVNADPVDVIDSTGFRLITEGPVRSMFEVDFYGWAVDSATKVNFKEITTIWAGKYNYENKVIAPNLPAGLSLITGLPRNFNDMPLEKLGFGKHVAMTTHDHQSYNKEFVIGLAVLLPDSSVVEIFDTPDADADLAGMWCAKLRLDDKGEASYKAFGAWEHQDTMFRNRDYFRNFIKSEGERMDHPVIVTVE